MSEEPMVSIQSGFLCQVFLPLSPASFCAPYDPLPCSFPDGVSLPG